MSASLASYAFMLEEILARLLLVGESENPPF